MNVVQDSYEARLVQVGIKSERAARVHHGLHLELDDGGLVVDHEDTVNEGRDSQVHVELNLKRAIGSGHASQLRSDVATVSQGGHSYSLQQLRHWVVHCQHSTPCAGGCGRGLGRRIERSVCGCKQ